MSAPIQLMNYSDSSAQPRGLCAGLRGLPGTIRRWSKGEANPETINPTFKPRRAVSFVNVSSVRLRMGMFVGKYKRITKAFVTAAVEVTASVCAASAWGTLNWPCPATFGF